MPLGGQFRSTNSNAHSGSALCHSKNRHLYISMAQPMVGAISMTHFPNDKAMMALWKTLVGGTGMKPVIRTVQSLRRKLHPAVKRAFTQSESAYSRRFAHPRATIVSIAKI
jgi:hypothetical protein